LKSLTASGWWSSWAGCQLGIMVARSFGGCEDGRGKWEDVRAEPSCLGVSDMFAVGNLGILCLCFFS